MTTNNIYQCPPSIARSVLLAAEPTEAAVGHHFVLKDLARDARTNECTLKKEFKNIC